MKLIFFDFTVVPTILNLHWWFDVRASNFEWAGDLFFKRITNLERHFKYLWFFLFQTWNDVIQIEIFHSILFIGGWLKCQRFPIEKVLSTFNSIPIYFAIGLFDHLPATDAFFLTVHKVTSTGTSTHLSVCRQKLFPSFFWLFPLSTISMTSQRLSFMRLDSLRMLARRMKIDINGRQMKSSNMANNRWWNHLDG